MSGDFLLPSEDISSSILAPVSGVPHPESCPPHHPPNEGQGAVTDNLPSAAIFIRDSSQTSTGAAGAACWGSPLGVGQLPVESREL